MDIEVTEDLDGAATPIRLHLHALYEGIEDIEMSDQRDMSRNDYLPASQKSIDHKSTPIERVEFLGPAQIGLGSFTCVLTIPSLILSELFILH